MDAMTSMPDPKPVSAWLTDMDGVLVHEQSAIPGAAAFIERLQQTGTNPDATGPTPDGPVPATGSAPALITQATGVQPYFVGKPNPLMMRSALNAIEAHSESTVMVGDRMDTDVKSGLEAGLRTVLCSPGRRRRTRWSGFRTDPRTWPGRSPI